MSYEFLGAVMRLMALILVCATAVLLAVLIFLVLP